MKKTVFLFLFILFIYNIGFTQLKEIVYDFKTGKFNSNEPYTLPEDLKYGDRYTVTIENINTYCYGVKIESESQVDSTTYNVPGITSLAVEAVTGLFSNITPLSQNGITQTGNLESISIPLFDRLPAEHVSLIETYSADESQNGFTDWLEKLFTKRWFVGKRKDKKLEAIMDAQNPILTSFESDRDKLAKKTNDWLDKANKFIYSSESLTFDINNFIKEGNRPKVTEVQKLISRIETNKSKYKNDIKPYSNELTQVKYQNRNDEIINAYDKKLIEKLKKIEKMLSAENINHIVGNIIKKRIKFEGPIITAIESGIDFIPSRISNRLSTIEELEIIMDSPSAKSGDYYDHDRQAYKLHKAFVTGRTSAFNYAKKANEALFAFQNELNKISSRIEVSKDLTEAIKEIETVYKKLGEAAKKHQENLNSEKWKALHNRLLAISYNKDFKYKSQPFEFYGDRGYIKITATPLRCEGITTPNSTIHHFPKKQKSKFATTTSFYISGLYDHVYSFRQEIENSSGMPDTVYYAVDEESSKVEFGTSISMNYTILSSDKVHLNIAVGPGISYSRSVRFRMLTGLNLAFGNRHRFSLGTGVITGYVDQLSNAVDINKSFREKPEQITVSKLKGAAYFNVGYQYRFNW